MVAWFRTAHVFMSSNPDFGDRPTIRFLKRTMTLDVSYVILVPFFLDANRFEIIMTERDDSIQSNLQAHSNDLIALIKVLQEDGLYADRVGIDYFIHGAEHIRRVLAKFDGADDNFNEVALKAALREL